MRRPVLPLLLLCLCTGGIASADPITITSGQLVLNQTSGYFQFNGVGLDAGGFLITGSNTFGCTPCPPDRAIPISFSRTVYGYPNLYGLGYLVNLDVQGPSFSSSEVSADHLAVSAPFTLTGTVSHHSDEFGPSDYFAEVIGSGTATMSFFPSSSSGLYGPVFHSVTYDFSPAASPTPEPGSLLLLGSGLTAAWQSRRFRRAP